MPIFKLKCGMREIRFVSLENMDSHMDNYHGGRWKYGDPDVVMLGDEESSESEEHASTQSRDNNSDVSESESGEE